MPDDDNDDTREDPKPVDGAKLQTIRQVESQVARATGRRYHIDLDALDLASLRGLARLLRDMEADKDAAGRRARMEPWRR